MASARAGPPGSILITTSLGGLEVGVRACPQRIPHFHVAG